MNFRYVIEGAKEFFGVHFSDTLGFGPGNPLSNTIEVLQSLRFGKGDRFFLKIPAESEVHCDVTEGLEFLGG